MQRNQKSVISHKTPQNLIPWIVIGVVVIFIVGVIIIQSFRPKTVPQPTAPMRYPRVHLIIKSNVGGAEVYLNGQQKTVVSDSRHEAKLLNLGRKTHEILLKKQGYADWTEMVEITGNTPVTNCSDQYATPRDARVYGVMCSLAPSSCSHGYIFVSV